MLGFITKESEQTLTLNLETPTTHLIDEKRNIIYFSNEKTNEEEKTLSNQIKTF